MRLTLRTLLAYIDNILEKDDHEELGRRVAGSDIAHDLIHRTRDATRRLRLPAPEVDASGPYSDANTVAEYLDNMLPPADVTQFERRCVEGESFPDADSYLAEVANCHHVLTMVLGQRAEIDSAVKERMYAIGKVEAVDLPAHEPAPQPPATSGVTEIPDYLRASERSLFSRLLPAIAAMMLLGVTLWFAFGPDGWLVTPTKVADAGGGDLAPPVSGGGTPTIEGGTGGESEVPAPPVLEPPLIDFPPTGEPDQPEDSPPPAMEPATDVDIVPLPPAPAPGAPVGDPETPPLPPEPASTSGNDPLAVPDPASIPSLPDTASSDPDMTAPSADAPEGDSTTTATSGSTPAGPDTAGADTPAGDKDPEDPPAPEPPKRVGLVGVAKVLLRHSPQDGNWWRLALRAELMPGDRLLSLPTYRPTINFDTGIALDLIDATLIESIHPEDSPAGIMLTYGQVLLTNTSQDAAEMTLAVGDHSGLLKLSPGASLAIRVRRPFQAGVDPRKSAAPLLAACYAERGGVEWAGQGVKIVATERSHWNISDGAASPVEPYKDNPKWVGGPQLSVVERQASPKLERQLSESEPIWSQLSVVNNSRLKEERALASIFSVHIGQFDSSVQSLRDEDQDLSWGDEIEALRFAMSSSTDLADAVYKELHRQHRKELADDLYEMLCGYNLQQVGKTADEQRVGAMRRLLDWMESDQLDFRVLANYNMEQITGRRGVFSPIGASGNRKTRINRQRARLEDGELPPLGLLNK